MHISTTAEYYKMHTVQNSLGSGSAAVRCMQGSSSYLGSKSLGARLLSGQETGKNREEWWRLHKYIKIKIIKNFTYTVYIYFW